MKGRKRTSPMCLCVSDWSTRVKQIAKLWRKASSQDRAPYVVSVAKMVLVDAWVQTETTHNNTFYFFMIVNVFYHVTR